MKKEINEDLINCLKQSIKILHEYSSNQELYSLRKNEMFYDACLFRVEMICCFFIDYQNSFNNVFTINDFIYFENLKKILKIYSKNHFEDLSYFLNNRLHYIETKLVKY